MTLSVPDALYRRMQEHSELKWSEVARQAFEKMLDELELLDDLMSIRMAQRDLKEGRTITHEELKKRLGIGSSKSMNRLNKKIK